MPLPGIHGRTAGSPHSKVSIHAHLCGTLPTYYLPPPQSNSQKSGVLQQATASAIPATTPHDLPHRFSPTRTSFDNHRPAFCGEVNRGAPEAATHGAGAGSRRNIILRLLYYPKSLSKSDQLNFLPPLGRRVAWPPSTRNRGAPLNAFPARSSAQAPAEKAPPVLKPRSAVRLPILLLRLSLFGLTVLVSRGSFPLQSLRVCTADTACQLEVSRSSRVCQS